MAYELFEQLFHQLGGKLPDAVIFPSGGGVGIIGMWKAFEEMEQLGWLDAPDTEGKTPAHDRRPSRGLRAHRESVE